MGSASFRDPTSNLNLPTLPSLSKRIQYRKHTSIKLSLNKLTKGIKNYKVTKKLNLVQGPSVRLSAEGFFQHVLKFEHLSTLIQQVTQCRAQMYV